MIEPTNFDLLWKVLPTCFFIGLLIIRQGELTEEGR